MNDREHRPVPLPSCLRHDRTQPGRPNLGRKRHHRASRNLLAVHQSAGCIEDLQVHLTA